MLFYSTILLILQQVCENQQRRRKGFLSCVFSSGKFQYTLLYHKINVSCNRCCNAHGPAVGSHTVRYVNIWQTQQIKQQRVGTLLTKSCIFSLHSEWHSAVHLWRRCMFLQYCTSVHIWSIILYKNYTPFPTDLSFRIFIRIMFNNVAIVEQRR